MKAFLYRTWNMLLILLNAAIIGMAIGLLAEALWRWR